MLNNNQKKKAVEIINEGLALSNVDFEPINEHDIFSGHENNGILFTREYLRDGKHPLEDFFNKVSKNRKNEEKEYFHFKNVNITMQILENKTIQVSNLISNQYNDFAEYSEFFNRVGSYYILIPKDFEGNYCEWCDSEIDRLRQYMLILCFARNNTNPRFWTEYANNDTGLCLKFRISNFRNQNEYNFRDVFYDSGYDVEFIKHINYYLKREFHHVILSSGFNRFAQFYKRNKYRYECETRFSFDAINPNRLTPLNLKLEENEQRKYITLPLIGNLDVNPFFDMKLVEITYGNNVNEDTKIELFLKLQSEFKYRIPLRSRNGDIFTYSPPMY